MKSKDTLLLEEAYINISTNASLRQMWLNDVKSSTIDEGIGDAVKTKLVQPIVDFLLKKIKDLAPDTFQTLSKAVETKDEASIKAIFNDPSIQQEQNKISQQVTTESLTYISEEEKSPSMLKSVWTWVKNNPKLSAVAALAALGVIGLAVYGSGGVVPLLMAVGSKSLSGATAGGIGGTVISGVKSALRQGKEGNISFKQTAKDALKGGAVGVATGAVGGALGAIGQSAAVGAGALADDAGKWIAQMMRGGSGSKALAAALQNPNLEDYQQKYLSRWLEAYKQGKLKEEDLSAGAEYFNKLAKGIPLEDSEWNTLKDITMSNQMLQATETGLEQEFSKFQKMVDANKKLAVDAGK